MMIFRGALAVFMIVVGVIVVIQMLRYPIAQSFTGLVLGGAMIALGIIRLRQVRQRLRER